MTLELMTPNKNKKGFTSLLSPLSPPCQLASLHFLRRGDLKSFVKIQPTSLISHLNKENIETNLHSFDQDFLNTASIEQVIHWYPIPSLTYMGHIG